MVSRIPRFPEGEISYRLYCAALTRRTVKWLAPAVIDRRTVSPC